MSPERWQQIKQVFTRVIDLPPDEQEKLLASSCGTDDDLRAEVERMLAADSEPLLENSPIHEFAATENSRFQNKLVGRYRILHEIGRGGMGTVFAAVRADGEFDQTVALKIIRSGLTTNVIERRFRHERQILASLQHQNIAHLLDGGMSDEGIPFYVMEYFAGEPIDGYCESNQLAINQILELFLQVCEAVSYAHGRLIVHRDLKPSNILVKEGQVKLLDFGIAKVLTVTDTQEQQTATQLGMMTPNYASPEQIRGETVTTASDVYSLGVVLFELLTGSPPYNLNGLRLEEMLRVVSDVEPTRPSRADASGETKVTQIPQLKGDLDNIILKALRKEPEHRYGSVEQFSDDVTRYLEGLPVSARPLTLKYKATKFVRRNRVAVAFSALVVLSLLVGIAATSWQAVRAEREKKLAQKRFEQSRQVANSMVFKYHDAIANLPNSSAVRELLLKDASAYLDDLAQDSKGDIALQRELAVAYVKLGDIQGKPNSTSVGNTAGAIESYEKAVALFEANLESNEVEIGQDLVNTYKKLSATLNRARENEDRRRELGRKRLALLERLVSAHPDNLLFMIDSTDVHKGLGSRAFRNNFDEGLAYFERKVLPMLAVVQRLAPDAPETENLGVSVYSNVGYYFSEHAHLLRDLDESNEKVQSFFQRSLDAYQKIYELTEKEWERGPKDAASKRGRVVGIVNVGIALREVGRIDEAFSYLERGRVIYEELVKFDDNNLQAVFDLGDYYNAVALCYLAKQDYDKAIGNFQQSLSHMERVIAADSKHHEAINYKVDVLVQLGNAYAEKGDFSRSLSYVEQARKFAADRLSDEPSDRVNLGRVHLKTAKILVKFAEQERSSSKSRELWLRVQAELKKAGEIIEQAAAPESQSQMLVVKHLLAKCEKAMSD